jgi:hypothetical protein
MTTADRILAQQRALEAGKAGYKRSDELLEELEADMKAGRIRLGESIALGDGTVGRLLDRFAEKSKVGAGLSVRRYEVEISRADDVAKRL